ncbi:hypothetical protein BU23DRAFT_191728 [Bimuria novae-zelandiae CBS 107.79]|uniref:Uncharacterized protein n=1 Tax=Bimuria novae-zelandiae CBS 107.79 TaxID=1447943 RepID=A0A6A5VNX2_9PLEO|nr:hypothetical protein BU23DRAFT_191728 [Bimuria novae-zelandiae CBS 107.79]
MHASLILLLTSLAASVVAAPMPNVSPSESPVTVREVDEDAIVPAVENMKREILERLDAIVQRSTPDDDLLDANEKRRLASGVIPPGLNARDEDRRDANDIDEVDVEEVEKRRVYDHSGVNKRRVYDHSGVNKRRVYDHSGVNKRRVYDHSGVNKRRVYDHSGVNKRRVYDHSGVNKRDDDSEYTASEVDDE